MKLNVMEKVLLLNILNSRITELERAPNYWTGNTPQRIIDKTLQEVEDVKSLKRVLLGEDE